MSAERLREAATKLREIGEAATRGPWVADGLEGNLDSPTVRVAEVGMWRDTDAAYIAMMSPPVALALADWLEYEAEGFWNCDHAAPEYRYIEIDPRERKLVAAITSAILGDSA